MVLSAYEKERLSHINNKMDEMYEHLDTIYELLVDREFDDLKEIVDSLMEELNDIKLSITDEL
jgi:hypothetical protein|tara:strand:+ start:4872 stop:5060 length:189 start_codon:yes stop_codon:yes gene_type:complete